MWEEEREERPAADKRPGGDLLLSHDPPLPPWAWEDRGYSDTLADLLDVVTDPDGPFATAARASPDPPLRIALCFKGAPPGGVCDGAPRAQRWLGAVDRFFEAAQARLAASGLEQPGQVEFVLDGNALPLGCLAQRWRPWASVWMNGSAPAAAFESDLPASEGLDRFRVLNEAARVDRWAYYADPKVRFGKFGRPSSPYPYQAWEPGAQATIQELVRVFAEGPPHGPGLDFATNADVAMLQLYAGVGLNQELPPPPRSTEESGGVEGLTGLVAVLRPGLAVVLEQAPGHAAALRAYTFDAGAPLSSLRNKELVPLPPAAGLGLAGWRQEEHGPIQSMAAVSPRALWLSTEKGHFFVYTILEEEAAAAADATMAGGLSLSLRLELQQAGSLAVVAPPTFAEPALALPGRQLRLRSGKSITKRQRQRRRSLSTTVLPGQGRGQGQGIGDDALRVLELFVPGGEEEQGQQEGEGECRLAYQIVTVPGASLLRPPACLWHPAAPSSGPESAAAVAVVEAGPNGETESLLVFAAAGGEVHALLLPLHGGDDDSCWVQIGVGHHVSAAAAKEGPDGAALVMLVAGGGWCYNSHLHNTGPADVCLLHPRPTPGVLDYSYGPAREWAARLRGACTDNSTSSSSPSPPPSSSRRALISACDARLLHGSYDLGTHPSLALYPLADGVGVGMLEVHAGFEADCPAEDVPPLNPPAGLEGGARNASSSYHWRRACDCGPALPRPGKLVADSFPLRL